VSPLLKEVSLGQLFSLQGGMKAVMWTDVFQTIVMFVGLLASVIQGRHSTRRCRINASVSSGVIDAGGAQAVWQRAVDGGRVEFFK
jgi:hypothetical protein